MQEQSPSRGGRIGHWVSPGKEYIWCGDKTRGPAETEKCMEKGKGEHSPHRLDQLFGAEVGSVGQN